MIGQTISHYQILEKLGEGGMGVVYKARDTKLDRDVALKFLPVQLADSAADRARFTQEARAAAALDHPNICTIFGIEEYDPGAGEPKHFFFAMTYVEGATLREKMPSLSTKQAIEIGIQIADGLAAAHEKGVVHRDIKPENIMIRRDGIVQVMDFGLAKLRASGSRITRLTKAGSTVGTAGYMSPEQVQGQETDHRSDIFSYGVLLHEMLTGQPPFTGVHETALAYEIVNTDPAPMSAMKPEIDPALDAIVLDCLEKDPKERTQSVAQVSLELKRYRRESSRQRVSRVTAARPLPGSSAAGRATIQPGETAPVKSRGAFLAWGAAAVLLALSAYLLLRPAPERGGRFPLVRSSIVTPDSIYIHSFGANLGAPGISPDGRAIAFAGVTRDGVQQIYVRRLDEMETRAIPGTQGGHEPFWSPDGKSIGFFADARMKKVDLVGGSPVTVTNVPNARGGTWNADGTIVFAPDYQSALYRVSADGGKGPVKISELDSARQEGSHRWPVFLPDGKHLLYLSRAASESGEAEGDAVFVMSLDGSVKNMLVQSSFNPAYAGGYLLFARSGVLIAQRFDTESLELSGDPIILQEGLLTDQSYNMAVYTVSTNGILLYQTGRAEAGARPMFVERSGKVVRLLEDRNEQDQPRFSPDGKEVALYLYDLRSRRSNIWIYDLGTGGRRRITTRSVGDFYPVWSSDGSRIFFSSGGVRQSDIFEQRVARSGGEELFIDQSTRERPLDCSPDGRQVLTWTFKPESTLGDLWLVPTTGENRIPVAFQQSRFDERDGRISRDGRWIAFVSDESGEDEIYLKRLSAPESDPVKISTGGGDIPVWGPTSAEVLYVNTHREVVSIALRYDGDTPEVAGTKKLFTVPPFAAAYDISPDGQTFIITRNLEIKEFPPLSLVMNWEQMTGKDR